MLLTNAESELLPARVIHLAKYRDDRSQEPGEDEEITYLLRSGLALGWRHLAAALDAFNAEQN
jgi:hypothetical protein